MSHTGEGSHASMGPTPVPVPQRGMPGGVAAALAVGVVAIVVGFALLGQDGTEPPAPMAGVVEATPRATGTPARTREAEPTAATGTPEPAVPQPTEGGEDDQPGVVRPTGGTPLPDVAGALPGDDGLGPLPLGTVMRPPDDERLDFLFELCPDGCFRDAHWIDPGNPLMGAGGWTAGRPFHVREGFPNDGPEPLGEGFDVVLYVTRLEGSPDEPTYRYTSDYVLRGTSDRCGPAYRTQAGPATCEWFVHDFPDGLAEGRFAIWAMWEAPCRAWVDLGLADVCENPDVVLSLFSSGFDAPYDASAPVYGEPATRGHSPSIGGVPGG